MPDRIARSVLKDMKLWEDRLLGNPPLEPWVKRMLYAPAATAAVFLGFAVGGLV